MEVCRGCVSSTGDAQERNGREKAGRGIDETDGGMPENSWAPLPLVTLAPVTTGPMAYPSPVYCPATVQVGAANASAVGPRRSPERVMGHPEIRGTTCVQAERRAAGPGVGHVL